MFTRTPKSSRILLVFVVVFFLWLPNLSAKTALFNNTIDIFSPPLGYGDGIQYGPRFTYDNSNTLIENTDYGIANPDLSHFSFCFDTDMRLLLHAGEDWYRKDGQSTAYAVVTSVANGTVYDRDPGPYPGEALVLEHHLSSGLVIYSVYMHIANVPSEIIAGQPVSRGQRLGTVLSQQYDGLYPNYHPSGDDSHLHFEMRYFASAADIYADHPDCNKGDVAGRGYTHPNYPPDTYPNLSFHYTDPSTFLQKHAGIFCPLTIRAEPGCTEGGQPIENRKFELGHVSWTELGGTIIYSGSPPLPTPAYDGRWAAWLAGRNNVNDVLSQEFYVPDTCTSATLTYYVWVGTDEISPSAYDYLYVRLRDENGNLLRTIDTVTNTFTPHVWSLRMFTVPDLGQYSRQTLRLSFEATTNSTQLTNFIIDLVGLAEHCGAGAQEMLVQPATRPYP